VHHSGGGEEREARDDHPVAWTNAQRPQGEEQGVGAAGYADRVLDTAVRRHFSLEGLYFRPQDEPPRLDDPLNGGVDVGLDGSVLPL